MLARPWMFLLCLLALCRTVECFVLPVRVGMAKLVPTQMRSMRLNPSRVAAIEDQVSLEEFIELKVWDTVRGKFNELESKVKADIKRELSEMMSNLRCEFNSLHEGETRKRKEGCRSLINFLTILFTTIAMSKDQDNYFVYWGLGIYVQLFAFYALSLF